VLPERADSERSWTVDFAVKRRNALDHARPHREAADDATALAKVLEEQVMTARATPEVVPNELESLEEQGIPCCGRPSWRRRKRLTSKTLFTISGL